MSSSLLALALSLLASGVARPPGTLLVLNKADATASLVDIVNGKVVATLPTGRAPHEVAVSPDARTAVATNYGPQEEPGGSLTVIDIPRARVLRTIDVGAGTRPHGIAFIDRQRTLVTAEGVRALLAVNVEGAPSKPQSRRARNSRTWWRSRPTVAGLSWPTSARAR
jgi:DNA-binding beta-propeller fold protein YncE